MLVVTLNGTPQPLFDGVMTNVEVQPGSERLAGTVTVTGEDLTKVMDMQDFSGLPFPAMPIEARVALLCAKYAPFGMIPLPIPVLFPDVPIPIDKIPAQQGHRPRNTSSSWPTRWATSSTSSPARRPAPTSPISAPRSKSACRSPRSTSTWTRSPTWSR